MGCALHVRLVLDTMSQLVTRSSQIECYACYSLILGCRPWPIILCSCAWLSDVQRVHLKLLYMELPNGAVFDFLLSFPLSSSMISFELEWDDIIRILLKGKTVYVYVLAITCKHATRQPVKIHKHCSLRTGRKGRGCCRQLCSDASCSSLSKVNNLSTSNEPQSKLELKLKIALRQRCNWQWYYRLAQVMGWTIRRTQRQANNMYTLA